MFCARAEIEHVIEPIFLPGGRCEISARTETNHVIGPLIAVSPNKFKGWFLLIMVRLSTTETANAERRLAVRRLPFRPRCLSV